MLRRQCQSRLILVFVFLVMLPGVCTAGTAMQPLLGIRLRQELFRNALHRSQYWSPYERESESNWIRLRSRLGFRWRIDEHHRFELRLLNEFRKVIDPPDVSLPDPDSRSQAPE